ncbi:ester cyclase [Streptomyces sioyaensis]|uniref:ester cyclase n=1 Tax=Streptomyces sioyaensis TaxID=67364 RepID=UPI0033C96F43
MLRTTTRSSMARPARLEPRSTGARQQLAAFDPLRVRVEELIGEDHSVVARVIQSGVQCGTHPRIAKPTGRTSEVEAIWIFTLGDGKITKIRPVSDRLGPFSSWAGTGRRLTRSGAERWPV